MKKFSITFEMEAKDGLEAMKAAVKMVEAAGITVTGNGVSELPLEEKNVRISN